LKGDYDFKRDIVSNLAENTPPSFNDELIRLALENTQREEEMLQELKRYIHIVGEVKDIFCFFSAPHSSEIVRNLDISKRSITRKHQEMGLPRWICLKCKFE